MNAPSSAITITYVMAAAGDATYTAPTSALDTRSPTPFTLAGPRESEGCSKSRRGSRRRPREGIALKSRGVRRRVVLGRRDLGGVRRYRFDGFAPVDRAAASGRCSRLVQTGRPRRLAL